MACALAVPLVFGWMLIDMVGGALVCAGADVSCGAGGLRTLAVLAAIAGGTAAVGWLVNRVAEASGCVWRWLLAVLGDRLSSKDTNDIANQ